MYENDCLDNKDIGHDIIYFVNYFFKNDGYTFWFS